MLKITVDLFSGRPNPSWIIDDHRGKEILDQISKNRDIISKIDKGYDGLGYRGIQIELMGDESIKGIPTQFAIANGILKNQKESLNIARGIVYQMPRYEKMSLDLLNITPVNKEMQQIIFEELDSYEKNIDSIFSYMKIRQLIRKRRSTTRVTLNDSTCQNCQYEESRYNPNFWNSNRNTRSNNNCYNYARNWRTDTFAQPGRYAGQQAANMSCAEVRAAALRDGLHERCNCLPQSEYPRRLMALVVAPEGLSLVSQTN